MRRRERTGLYAPAVLAVAGPLLAAASAGAAVLLGGTWRQAVTAALLVPLVLSTALGLRVLGAALQERGRPGHAVTIDLRDRPRTHVPMPRQDRQPLDDVPKRGRGAP